MSELLDQRTEDPVGDLRNLVFFSAFKQPAVGGAMKGAGKWVEVVTTYHPDDSSTYMFSVFPEGDDLAEGTLVQLYIQTPEITEAYISLKDDGRVMYAERDDNDYVEHPGRVRRQKAAELYASLQPVFNHTFTL